ncbi:MAG: DUF2007 domain-containing protein [Alistipes sp.]|nr:DUF2007 domain-containing protein [Alistipes sp.]
MGNISNSADTLVALREYNNTVQAEIAKSMLDSAGICCVLHGEYMSSIYCTGAFPVRLMVRSQDVEEANRILLGR